MGDLLTHHVLGNSYTMLKITFYLLHLLTFLKPIYNSQHSVFFHFNYLPSPIISLKHILYYIRACNQLSLQPALQLLYITYNCFLSNCPHFFFQFHLQFPSATSPAQFYPPKFIAYAIINIVQNFSAIEMENIENVLVYSNTTRISLQ